MGAMSRDKGARAERDVVRWLRERGWPDARRYLAGDGRQPGDIDWHPLVCLEVKDRAKSSWPSWCRQVVAECRPGMVPCVVRKTAGVTDVGEWEVRVKWREWYDVLGQRRLGRQVYGVWCPDGECPDYEACPGHDWYVLTMADLADAVAAVDAS